MPSDPAPPTWPYRWPGWAWAALAAGVVLLALLAWFAFKRGELSGGYDRVAVASERRELESRLALLEQENARLNAQVAELEMARQLDRDAYGQVERSIGELQSQLSRQGDDLAFYRSIVSPADGIQGLRIHRFEVLPGSGPREFRLELMLLQAMRHESVASGLVQVALHGLKQGRPARVTVGELLGRPRAQLPFSFRYFQTIEQTVTLPADFEPMEVEIEVRSRKLRSPIRQSYPWKPAPPAPT